MGKYDSGKQHEWRIPPFFPFMNSKMGQYPQKMGKMGNIPPKKNRGKKAGGDEEFVLFIHI